MVAVLQLFICSAEVVGELCQWPSVQVTHAVWALLRWASGMQTAKCPFAPEVGEWTPLVAAAAQLPAPAAQLAVRRLALVAWPASPCHWPHHQRAEPACILPGCTVSSRLHLQAMPVGHDNPVIWLHAAVMLKQMAGTQSPSARLHLSVWMLGQHLRPSEAGKVAVRRLTVDQPQRTIKEQVCMLAFAM